MNEGEFDYLRDYIRDVERLVERLEIKIEEQQRQLDEHQKNLEYLSKVTSVKEKEIGRQS